MRPWSVWLQILKHIHVEPARGATFFRIVTKGMIRGPTARGAYSALEMPPLSLKIGSHGALAPSVLALPEGLRAFAGVTIVLERANSSGREVVAIRAVADPWGIAVVLPVFPEAGFCAAALARRQPRHTGHAGVALGYARPVCFFVIKSIRVSNRVTPCMVESNLISALLSQGERPMSVLSKAIDVHGCLVATVTATLAVAAVATRTGSMFPRARSMRSMRTASGGHPRDLCQRRSSMLPKQLD
jgi:hypothetical protein